MSVASRASSLARRWARRLLSLVREPYIRVKRTRMMRQSARGSIDTSRHWRRRRFTVTILEIFSYLGAIVLVVVVVWSFVVMIIGPGILTRLNNRCGQYSASCGADVGFLIPLPFGGPGLGDIPLLPAPPRDVPGRQEGKGHARAPGRTATPDIGKIVGRDELCRVIMEDIHQSDTRRPHCWSAAWARARRRS